MRKNFTLSTIALPLLLLWFSSTAQEVFTNPPARYITKFKFQQFSGGVVMIRGCVNQYTDSLNFILDTGSGGISLDSSTVSDLAIPTVPSDRTIRGIAGVHKVNFLYGGKLHLPGLTVDSLDFHVNDYDILTSVYGVKIDGIIGYSFLSKFIVRIDYDSLLISVYSPGEFKYKRGGHILKPTLASIPVVSTDFRDQRSFNSKFYFDTGAGLCFLISDDFAKDSAALNPRKKPVVTQAEGLGGKMAMQLTTVKDVKVGPYRFRNVPTFIFEDEYNVTSYPYLAGLVGNDLLRRFNIVLNYPRKEIHISPNSHFNDLFDYAYTGLGIYFEDGKIKVEDVIDESPAAVAGFKHGDVILGVGNNLSNNIQLYKNMLQSVGEKIKVLILRDNEPVLLTIRPKSIL
ncbi:MAG: signal protein PDZ [Bacteroidetes bacterium]|nr:MAG: signal protein PDZ [Bacteroidota bacterium]